MDEEEDFSLTPDKNKYTPFFQKVGAVLETNNEHWPIVHAIFLAQRNLKHPQETARNARELIAPLGEYLKMMGGLGRKVSSDRSFQRALVAHKQPEMEKVLKAKLWLESLRKQGII